MAIDRDALEKAQSAVSGRTYFADTAQEYNRDLIVAYLDAMRAKGFKMMPREPTGDESGWKNMQREGATKMWEQQKRDPVTIGLPQAAEIWRAMYDSYRSDDGEGGK